MVDELTILKSIHLLAAAFWVGGGFLVNLAMYAAARSGDSLGVGTVLAPMAIRPTLESRAR